MVFIPRATHDRFNTVWAANEAVEWPSLRDGITLPGVPDRAMSTSTHETLAREFIGGFFDLILNGNSAEQPRFRNEVKSPTGVAISHQWQFATASQPIDTFTGTAADLGTRTLPAGATVERFAPLTPVAGRDEKIPHDDNACILTTSSAGTPTIVYEFTGSPPTGFDTIRFRLGHLYPSLSKSDIDTAVTHSPASVDVAKLRELLKAKQDEINLVKPPEFDVILEDADNKAARIAHASLLLGQQNGWARPEAKVPVEIVKLPNGDIFAVAKDCTLMSLQTLQIKTVSLVGIDPSKLRKIRFEFKAPATPQEVWLDSIDFVLT
jgi:hypothetical protein